jgi:hypothetical protein
VLRAFQPAFPELIHRTDPMDRNFRPMNPVAWELLSKLCPSATNSRPVDSRFSRRGAARQRSRGLYRNVLTASQGLLLFITAETLPFDELDFPICPKPFSLLDPLLPPRLNGLYHHNLASCEMKTPFLQFIPVNPHKTVEESVSSTINMTP